MIGWLGGLGCCWLEQSRRRYSFGVRKDMMDVAVIVRD
jgi:hypothetical protein